MRLPKSLPKPKKPKLLIARRVVGASMQPRLAADHIVWASGLFKRVRAGDVVVLEHNGLEKIKRVEAVQDGQLFVLGDNALASTDSRSFGWLDISAVIGKVIWPRI